MGSVFVDESLIGIYSLLIFTMILVIAVSKKVKPFSVG